MQDFRASMRFPGNELADEARHYPCYFLRDLIVLNAQDFGSGTYIKDPLRKLPPFRLPTPVKAVCVQASQTREFRQY